MQKAEALYPRALEGYEELCGPKHMLTLAIVNNLSIFYKEQGKLQEAKVMYQRVLEGSSKAWGLEQMATPVTVNNLGLLLQQQGKMQEAKAEYQRALEGYEKKWGQRLKQSTTWVFFTPAKAKCKKPRPCIYEHWKASRRRWDQSTCYR